MKGYRQEGAVLVHGDSRAVLRSLPEGKLDACITDPPYALVSIGKRFGKPGAAPAKSDGATGVYARASAGFMGQQWDTGETAFDPAFWAEVLRVLKPGAHLLAFGGTRTFHRLTVAIEDAGFEIRDTLMWVYGSGFPKSHNLDDQWEGWGTALKPAWEPIIMARRPLVGTVAANVLAHGTGALNIDGCRVPGDYETKPGGMSRKASPVFGAFAGAAVAPVTDGRWPANVIHDGSPEVLEVFAAFGEKTSGARKAGVYGVAAPAVHDIRPGDAAMPELKGDSGSAARFFYCAKASKSDRGEGNTHPTVKPTALMQYLCRLVTPAGGTVLDPFMGSGSTGKAARAEGFKFVGIDQEEKYVAIARERVK